MRIVFLGPPGAGKGTQAERLARSLRVPHVSTGEMMRGAIAEASELGKRVQSFVDAGNLVPDSLVNEIVQDRLPRPDCATGFLLDGYPRTLPQAAELDAILHRMGAKLSCVIDLQVSTEVLVDRLVKRGKEKGRSDDTEEVIRKRLAVYENDTKPLTDFYAKKGLLIVVDGLGSIDEVEIRILEACEKVKS